MSTSETSPLTKERVTDEPWAGRPYKHETYMQRLARKHPRVHLATCLSAIAGLLWMLWCLTQAYDTDVACETFPWNAKEPPKCHQAPALFPAAESEDLTRGFAFLSSPDFRNKSIDRLSGAVQVRTESFDDLGEIDEDSRWDVFFGFADYLKAIFPRTHEQLKVEKINTHGLLFTWLGSDEKLKPTLLMAHQDTVPVPAATVDSWTHPPFGGFYDGHSVWGRGSSDCKNSLIAILETVEMLLEADFEPNRTIVLSFGFDEESSGRQGAGHLSAALLARYGKSGIATLVDEGMGYSEAFGSGFAVPGVAEKGYTDVDVTIRSPAGHSSVPYDHTSIGIMSELIAEIEAHQYRTYLHDTNPYLSFLSCGAEHAPGFPKKLRHLLTERLYRKCSYREKDPLAIEAAKLGRTVKYLMQTSQAVDLIHGGVKTNAMPETVEATVNHRINIGDKPETAWNHLTALAKPIAKKYNLTLHAFDNTTEADNAITLHARDTVLQVAPVTPTDTSSVTPYSVLAGSVRALFGEDIIVAPAIMTGNTDTRYYWDLTPHIFRFAPGMIAEKEDCLGNIHTVDEKVSVQNHVSSVQWYWLFLRNMDEAVLE